MALFKRDFNKPGPGVPKNAPKKKGIARLVEILHRDFSNIFKLNLLVFVCLLPAELLFFFSVLNFLAGNGFGFLFFGALALVASILIGPARTAESYLLSKMLRDDPGFIWHDFKKSFKDNFKISVIPGILYSLIVGSQILGVIFYLFASASISFVWVVFFIFSILIFFMASPYFFLQVPYMELGAGAMLKNSLLLALGNAPLSAVGGLLYVILLGAQLLIFPYAIPLTIAFGYTIPALLNLMFIWPKVDKTFAIDATLKERSAKALDEALEDTKK